MTWTQANTLEYTSGKESLVTEEGTRILNELLKDVEANPGKYRGRNLTAELEAVANGFSTRGITLAGERSTDIIVNNQNNFITKEEFQEALNKSALQSDRRMQKFMEELPQFIFVEKGKKGKAIPISKLNKYLGTIRG